MNGFLGTYASLGADLSLISSVGLFFIAVIGYLQARRKKFDTHGSIMPWAALLNWIPILLVMVPRFLNVISGQLTLTSGSFSIMPIFHGGIGLVTQLLLTYTVIRMQWAPNWPPKKPLWLMRIALILWTLTVIGGVFLYLASYVL
ncbi:hypothetical protein KQH56_00680 [bacterium]|nr:hypothetical protein [bacterium]